MTEPAKQQRKVKSPVYEANEIPKEERASQSGDDAEAETEVKKHGEGFEAARPWRVAKSLVLLREQVNAMAPSRSKASDGTIGDPAHQSRDSDHNPWIIDGRVGVVTAMDITNDVAHGCDAQKIADALHANKDPRVKYIIWNSRIARSYIKNGKAPWTWLAYTGSNPHDKHVHISVRADKGNYDSTKSWTV